MQTHSESHSDAGTVGTSPAALSPLDFPVYDGVFVRADDDNEGTIKVGSTADIEAGRGYPLSAGQSVKVKVDRLSRLRVVASEAGQAYTWLAV